MVPVRKQSAALPACHDSVDIQPTMYDRGRWYSGGANSETQWYWPPEVGALGARSARVSRHCRFIDETHIDAISARLSSTKVKPTNVQMKLQNKPADPPLMRPCVLATRIYSHIAVITMAKLRAERGR